MKEKEIDKNEEIYKFEIKEVLLKKIIKEELDDIPTPDLEKLYDNICKKISED